jgi:hypothetical protein
MGLRDGVASIIAFLRAGYPRDAPAVGYAPLLALVPRRISDDDVATITSTLIVRKRPSIDRAETAADVGVEITRITGEMPSLVDIARVQHRLDALGWAGG